LETNQEINQEVTNQETDQEVTSQETINESAESDEIDAIDASSESAEINDAALLEAVLYLETEPVDEKALARITHLTEEAVATALETLNERYSSDQSGIELIKIADGISLAPKKGYWEMLKERYGRKNEARLSRAAIETLSIIAYRQPITRGDIEALRGVQADNMIRLLLDRKLIRENGKREVPGHPVLFSTTNEFLSLFRLGSIADLPRLAENEAERFELQNPE
jgi:segregation and condensation protein B